jgi:hypothetical protein
MKLTIAEVKEMFKKEFENNEIADIEVYAPMSEGKHYPNHFSTDNCKPVDEYDDSTLVGLWELMDETDYEHSILGNSSERADFEAWYDDKNAKVLVLLKSTAHDGEAE